MKRPELTAFKVRQQTRNILPERVLDIRRAPAAFRRRPRPVLGSLSVISLTLGLAIGGGFWLRRNHVQREMALEALVAERTRSLQSAQLQVRTLFLNSPLAICLATPAGDILAVNPALATLTGYPEKVLEQTNVFELFDTPELRQRQDIAAGKLPRGIDVPIVNAAGQRVETHLSVSRLGGMDQETLLWVFDDVSEQVTARETLRETYATLHRRHRIAEGMRDVMVALNSSQPLSHVLTMIASQAQDLLGASAVTIGALDEASQTLKLEAYSDALADVEAQAFSAVPYAVLKRAAAAGAPLVFPAPGDERPADWTMVILATPISVAAAGYTGSLLLCYPDRHSVADAETELATLFAAQAALAIENAQLKASAQEMATINERNRVARELHDSVTQSLYGIILNSDATLLALSAGNSEKAEQRLRQLKEIAREAMTETRLLIYQLRPSILEELGLTAALRERLEAVEVRSGLEVTFQIDGDVTLPPDGEAELFRAILEGLNNIIKHARARHVQLQIAVLPGCCRVILTDDGVGFDVVTAARYGGYGLKTIEERLHQVGGTVSIISEPGAGTQLEMETPL